MSCYFGGIAAIRKGKRDVEVYTVGRIGISLKIVLALDCGHSQSLSVSAMGTYKLAAQASAFLGVL